MFSLRDYTDRAVRDEEGNYFWRGTTDREFEIRKLKVGFNACIVIFVSILLIGIIFSLMLHDMRSMIPVLISAAVYMVIVFVIFSLAFYLTKDSKEVYFMTDSFIRSGTGKSTETFSYSGAKKVILTNRYIELNGRFRRMRVYVAAEDMSFVKNYIMSRVPGDVQTIYM